jgi:hypothetical protein
MITCNLMGGLGNQLFQIFATISYGIKSTKQFKFLDIDYIRCESSTTLRYTFWNTFFSKLKPFLITELPHVKTIREKEFSFNELSIYEIVNNDIMIYGYFQSYKYFENFYSTICNIIGLNGMKNDLTQKMNLTNEYLENSISMHFRIGDYKKFQEFHPLATYDYYERSINYIKNINSDKKYNVIYFCEDIDLNDVLNTVNKLQHQFLEYTFIRGDNSLADWEQMLLMSLCHHNIIANSSFSWWGAYFNSWNNKIVCYPSVWFGKDAKIDTKDLCPIEWIKIQV